MKLFYSWQSDLPNPTNRSFIQKALENAASRVRDDESIEVEPRVDRDTSGVPGSPDIASTILQKIDECDAFVADVSIINKGRKRLSPNPNVLIELGYALKAKGSKNIILVMNTAFGKPEKLPFDLRARRITSYTMPLLSEDRATERKRLETMLEEAIRMISINVGAHPSQLIDIHADQEPFDQIAEIDRELAFKRQRSQFLNSDSGLATAVQELDHLCTELKMKVEEFDRRSSELNISFREDNKQHWTVSVRNVSLVVSWTPPPYANQAANAELYLGLWESKLGRPRIDPREIRSSRYKPDLDPKKGVGWVENDSKGEVFLSARLVQTWFQRLLDHVRQM